MINSESVLEFKEQATAHSAKQHEISSFGPDKDFKSPYLLVVRVFFGKSNVGSDPGINVFLS